MLLSTHAAVSLITYVQDRYPEACCHLDLVDNDIMQIYWSVDDQWVGNKHNYYFASLQRNLTHMIHLEEIHTDPPAPKFAQPHPKDEFIWPKLYGDGWVSADLQNYPAAGQEVHA